MSTDTEKFCRLGQARRIWAVGAVHGEVARLQEMHDRIGPRFQPGDRLVYLGNLIGLGEAVLDTLAEALHFRRAVLALQGVLASDVVFLRGAQEEMWQKLLQLQFAPNPLEVLNWMCDQGVGATLKAYGGRRDEGERAARDGAVQMTRWTNRLRDSVRAAPGHYPFYAALKRAAFNDHGVLCVNANVDTARPLAAQGDSFWWGGTRFSALEGPYETFTRLIRGYDSGNNGIVITDFTASLDGGCGRGGTLAAGLFQGDGTLIEVLEA
ncbi:MAG: hypothetical protein KDA49_16120 [Rhodospirillaceae bacterium]|nr:hypothetical protein [Rhodospirillaceae bacterium]